MRKGSDIIGLKVISEEAKADEKANLGTVKDLIFDHETDELLALLISEKDLFGLIDAQIVPWNQVLHVGADAVMVQSTTSKIPAHDDARVKEVMDRETVLSGTKIYTTDGKDLGTFADMYVDEHSGRVVGYEVSGGFVSDTMSGKRFIQASEDINIAKDVALVPPSVAADIEAQKEQQPGGLKGATASLSEKASETYANIASASIDKQKEFVVGKTAGRDVFLPADQATTASTTTTAPTSVVAVENSSLSTSTLSEPTPTSTTAIVPVEDSAAAVTPSSELNNGEILVRQGETITQAHADRAESAGILHQLLVAVTQGAASETYAAGAAKVSATGAGAQESAREAAIGKPAGRDVLAPDGSVLVAPGMIITREILDQARAVGKENDVIAAAGVGVASQQAETVKASAGNLWDSIKHKAAELTGAAQDKKAEYDAQAEQAGIKNALGRPTTRVILDTSDKVILNAGELITHAAVEQARAAGVLDILLDSVYVADPEITPDMLRAKDHGQASIESEFEARQEQAAGDGASQAPTPAASQPA